MSGEAVDRHSAIPVKAYENVTFPVDTFKEAAIHLRRPFSPAAVKWKVQASFPQNPTGAIVVAYIDARLVVDRLNLVCPHLWHDEYEVVEPGKAICRLTIDGITRIDVGIGQGQGGDTTKGMYSDAIKRAGVRFGVGVPLYAIPKMLLDVREQRQQGKVVLLKKDGKVKRIEPDVEKYLRDQYSSWLDRQGTEAFGPYLDHGDSEDSVGDLVDDEPAGQSQRTQVEAHGSQTETTPPVTSAMRKNVWEAIKTAGLDKDDPEHEKRIKAIFEWVAETPHSDRIPRDRYQAVLDAVKEHNSTISDIADMANDPDIDGHVQAKAIVEKYLSEES